MNPGFTRFPVWKLVRVWAMHMFFVLFLEMSIIVIISYALLLFVWGAENSLFRMVFPLPEENSKDRSQRFQVKSKTVNGRKRATCWLRYNLLFLISWRVSFSVPLDDKVPEGVEPRFWGEEGFYVGTPPQVSPANLNIMENRIMNVNQVSALIFEDRFDRFASYCPSRYSYLSIQKSSALRNHHNRHLRQRWYYFRAVKVQFNVLQYLLFCFRELAGSGKMAS